MGKGKPRDAFQQLYFVHSVLILGQLDHGAGNKHAMRCYLKLDVTELCLQSISPTTNCSGTANSVCVATRGEPCLRHQLTAAHTDGTELAVT